MNYRMIAYILSCVLLIMAGLLLLPLITALVYGESILPFAATMDGARLHLGYRRLVDAAGRSWRGHEFHYSELVSPAALPSVAVQYNARGEQVPTPLYRFKNVIAGYTHLYWGEAGILSLWD